MLVFVLVLLLIAAALGVLGAVLKFTIVVVLSLALAIVISVAAIWWFAKRQTRRYVDSTRSKTRQVYEAEGRVLRPDMPERTDPN
jgi:membrane protein implicated in regulation of membrane protease activity